MARFQKPEAAMELATTHVVLGVLVERTNWFVGSGCLRKIGLGMYEGKEQ